MLCSKWNLVLAAFAMALCCGGMVAGAGQTVATAQAFRAGQVLGTVRPRRDYLQSRTVRGGGSAAMALAAARRRHLALAAMPRAANLSARWEPVGPQSVANPVYGAVSGRVTALLVDPSDSTGNTVYVGTTGGGVWKSLNAAGPLAAVTFAPLTDTLPVFDLSAGTSVLPSLSIGSLAIGGGVLLAGTGDPNDATDSYYGGGILRSTDAGATWTLADEAGDGTNPNRSLAGMSVAGLAFSLANPKLAVAALAQSAEGLLVNAGAVSQSLRGLYVSEDAGLTWQVATVMDGTQVVQSASQSAAGGGNGATSVVWNPARALFIAALSGHGYYGSADGMNWTRLAGQPGVGMTVANCPVESPAGPACPLFRGTLAVDASSGDTFALTVDASDGDQGLYRDICAITPAGGCANAEAFGVKLNSSPLEIGGGSTAIAQGGYNLALAAAPSGARSAPDTLLYVGTIDLYRCSLAAGCVLRNTTNAQNGCATPAAVAGAQHAIAVGAASTIFVGNDGGLWRSLDGIAETGSVCSAADASHFDNLNPSLGSLAEVVGFAQDPLDNGTLLAGFGALGSASTATAPADAAWAQMSTGEGGLVAIDQVNPMNWYLSNGAGVEIAACAKGSACGLADFLTPAIGAAQVDGDAALEHAPWQLDPGLTDQVLVGTCRLWRGTAAAWAGSDPLSAPFADDHASACGPSLGLVRSIGAGGVVDTGATAPNAGSEVLYAGLAGAANGGGAIAGHLFTTQQAQLAGSATAWTDAALASVTNDTGDAGKFNPGAFDISSITVDPHNTTGTTVYATVMGFAGNGVASPHVYRSTDGGAHWLNVSANLPNAPANSVVVDPNDANTVYVALDTGVYVTTSIASCPGSNCWDVYGVGLPDSPAIQLAAAVAMPTGDGRTGELRVGTYGRGIWQIPLVTAVLPAAPAMALSPANVTFPSQPTGTQSASVTITVTNTGNAPLSVTRVVTSMSFVETDGCAGETIAVGATCSIAVSFAPATTGPLTGLLTVYGNVAGGQATASLSGVGTAPAAIMLTPAALMYGPQTIGSSSAAQNIAVSNTGGSLATIQVPALSGDFKVSANSCATTLAPGVGCTLSIEFVPTASGARTGTLTVTDSAGSQSAQLSGTGVSPATDALSPLSLSFGPQQLATPSAAQQLTLTNSGDAALTLIAPSVTGDFAVVNACGASLAGHSSCALQVSYVPKGVGAETGILSVADEFRTQSVLLTGTGIAPPGVSLAPTGPLAFSATPVGQTSAGQAVTLTNNGGLPLILGSVSASGDFAIAPNACGPMLAAGANCVVTLSFSPTVAGQRSGVLTFTDNAASSPQTLPLNGVGIDFALGADGGLSQTVSSGQTATYLLLLTSVTGVPGSAAFTCSGVPAGAVCTVTPPTAPVYAPGGTVITVTIATGGTGARLEGPAMPWDGPSAWLALALPAGLLAKRRRRAATVLLLLIASAGCATIGRTIPPGSGGGTNPPVVTPTGSYTIVVAGSSAGLVRAVNLTLIVQ